MNDLNYDVSSHLLNTSHRSSILSISLNFPIICTCFCVSDTDSIWKGSLVGAKIHTTPANMNLYNFVKGALEQDDKQKVRWKGSQHLQTTEEKMDIVHIKMLKNNTFITITDYKGNKKAGASSGCLEELKGSTASRYAAESTAEHMGRVAKNLGLRSVIMRVNGFMHFRKKRQAILGFKEGYTMGKGNHTPIAVIEDTTQRAHNGCRLRKKRRI